MTSTRYVLARIAQSFGYIRKSHRLGEAVTESHLLREAEAYLGMLVWKKVESIDSLAVEYWNLRKLISECDEVNDKIAECRQRVNQAQEDRLELTNGKSEPNDAATAEQARLIDELEKLILRRDTLVAEAREVRRLYTGTKTKIEVLEDERDKKGTDEDHLKKIEEVSARLLEIKKHFETLKESRKEVGHEIERTERQLDQVEEKIKTLRQERRKKAAESFHLVGEMNKELSQLRARAGILELQIRQLYMDIGRCVSLSAQSNPQFAEAARDQAQLIRVMKALRRSVDYNQKLANTAN